MAPLSCVLGRRRVSAVLVLVVFTVVAWLLLAAVPPGRAGAASAVPATGTDADQDIGPLRIVDPSGSFGIWSDGTTLWVAAGSKLLAYTLSTGQADPSKDIALTDTADSGVRGIVGHGSTLYVKRWETGADGARSDAQVLYAYELADGATFGDYVAARNVSFSTAGTACEGHVAAGIFIFDDPGDSPDLGPFVWVSSHHGQAPAVCAFRLSDGSYSAARSFTSSGLGYRPAVEPGYFSGAWGSLSSLWSDGETLWVAASVLHFLDEREHSAFGVYAYDLETKARKPSLDLGLGTPSNRTRQGMWSDGETLWVYNTAAKRVDSFVLPEAPAAPAGVAATAGDGSLSLSWTAVPAGEVGSSSLSGYEIRWRWSSDRDWTSEPRTPATAASARVAGLVNGTEYVVQVRAVNSQSHSDWVEASAVPAAGAAAGTPPAPGDLTARAHFEGGVVVGWTALTEPGDGVTGYKVRWRDAQWSAGGAWNEVELSGAATSNHVVEDLFDLGRYDIAVHAVNAAGTGAGAHLTHGGLQAGFGVFDVVALGIHTHLVAAPHPPVEPPAFAEPGGAGLRVHHYSTTGEQRGSGFALPETIDGARRSGGMWGDSGGGVWVLYGRVTDGDMRMRQFDVGGGVSRTSRASLSPRQGHTPVDLWADRDSDVVWVLYPDGLARAYDLEGGRRLELFDFSVSDHLSSGAAAGGLWGDETIFWVSDVSSGLVLAVDRETLERRPELDMTLGDGSARPPGPNRGAPFAPGRLWSEGEVLLSVVDGRVRAMPMKRRPPAPASLTVTAGDRSVTVAWTGTAAGYELHQRDDSASGAWTAVQRTDPAAASEAVTSLTNGVRYQYRVRAVDGDLSSRWSEAVATTPTASGAPSALSRFTAWGDDAADGGPGVGVSWSAVASTSNVELRHRNSTDDRRGGWVSASTDPSARSDASISFDTASAWIAAQVAGDRYEVHGREVNSAGVAGPWSAATSRAGSGIHHLGVVGEPRGVASVDGVLWVSSSGEPGILRAFDLATKERIPDRDLNVDTVSPRGMSKHDPEALIWIADRDSVLFVQTSDGVTEGRISLRAGNLDPGGATGSAIGVQVTQVGPRGDPATVFSYRPSHIGNVNWVPRPAGPIALRDPQAPLDPARSVLQPGSISGSESTLVWIVDRATNRAVGYDGNGRRYGYTISAPDGVSWTMVDLEVVEPYAWVLDAGDPGTGRAPRVVRVLVPDLPAPPVNVEAAHAAGSVTLSWTAPPPDLHGSSEIESYDVRFREIISFDFFGPSTMVARSDPAALSETVTGLTDGVRYELAARSVNAESFGAWAPVAVLAASAAGRPVTVSATAVGSGSVTVSWAPPSSDGGVAVVSYDVEYKSSTASAWTSVSRSDPAALSETLTGLTDGTAYDFRVRVSETADMERGNPWAVARAAAAAVPGAATGVRAAPADRSLRVSWTAPSGTVSSYQVRHRRASQSDDPAGAWSVAAAAASPHVVARLVNGLLYDVQARARNTAGAGPWSAVVQAAPGAVPGAPTALVLTPGDATIDAAWAPPSADGGHAVTSYRVRWRPASPTPPDWTQAASVAPGAGLAATISGLANGTGYEVCVDAVNDFGEGACAVATTSPASAPPPPRGLALVPSDARISVTWQPSTDSTVTGHRVRYRALNTASWRTAATTSDNTTTSAEISGLVNGTAYEVHVDARSGSSVHGPPARAVATPVGAPSAPLRLRATGADGEISVTWDAPASDGGLPVKYNVKLRPPYADEFGAAIEASSSSGHTFGALLNGSLYRVCVTAVNDAGESVCATGSATPVAVPGPPREFTAIAASNGLSLSWTPPEPDGGGIDSYEIRYLSGASALEGGAPRNAVAVRPTPGQSTFATRISGLRADIYHVQTRAVNTAGPGEWVGAVVQVLPVPGRVETLAVKAGPAALKVDWAPPANELETGVTGYELQHAPRGSGAAWETVTLSRKVRSASIDQLSPGSRYRIRVRAVRSTAEGAAPVGGPWRTVEATTFPLAGLTVARSAATEASGRISFTVTLNSAAGSSPLRGPVTVDYRTSDDTGTDAVPATAGTDYQAVTESGSVTLRPGQSTATFTIDIIDDAVPEPDETFLVTISSTDLQPNPDQATAVGTIIDADTAPAPDVPSGGGVPGGGGGVPGGGGGGVPGGGGGVPGGGVPGGGGGGVPGGGVPGGGGGAAGGGGGSLVFVDVDAGSVHAAGIGAIAAAGITSGCASAPARYCPDDPVTRAQMATFLVRALGLSGSEGAPVFVDVDAGSVHAADIGAIAVAGITSGCASEPARYCPDDPVTRAQMATFLVRALGLSGSEGAPVFVDVDAGSVHAADIGAIAVAGITSGCASEPARYCPDDPVTRAQMATFLARALDL